ncbi:hypothetical protein TMatcc_010870 [Talaromyces marneffei ATCC 18224]|nr:hypothetical protein EYB25_003840 [Talaromyces marneffei]
MILKPPKQDPSILPLVPHLPQNEPETEPKVMTTETKELSVETGALRNLNRPHWGCWPLMVLTMPMMSLTTSRMSFDDVENVLDESQELQDVLEDGNGAGDEAGHGRSDGFDDGEHGGHAGGNDDGDGWWWQQRQQSGSLSFVWFASFAYRFQWNLAAGNDDDAMRLMNEFESLKRRFDIDTDTEVLPLAMNLETSDYYDTNDGEVILQSEDLEELFHPIIENVTGLINKQAVRTKAENKFPISISQASLGRLKVAKVTF